MYHHPTLQRFFRGSGRTTRAMQEALDTARSGKQVILLCAEHIQARNLSHYLSEIDKQAAEKIVVTHVVDLPLEGLRTLLPKTLSGAPPSTPVAYEHTAIEKLAGHLIDEWLKHIPLEHLEGAFVEARKRLGQHPFSHEEVSA